MSTIGASSSIDVQGIVSQLMQIERRPLEAMQKNLSGIQTKLSALGKLQSALSAFQDAARALTRSATWQAASAGADQVAANRPAGMRCRRSRRGKSVRIRRGPATVTGERTSRYATGPPGLGRQRGASNREPGDLP